jgi:hypothetical protein
MPDPTPMTDDEFRQLVSRTLGEHDTRMAAHEAAMARMDRQFEKLLDVQLDLARSHDEHEGKMDQLRRMQASQQRTQTLQAETMAQMQLTLDAIKEILRERRN